MKNKTVLIQLSETLRMRRLYLKLSQQDLAKKAKISQGTVAQIESGRKLPSLTTLLHLSRALDLSLGQIFDGQFMKERL